jgi:hypothetical protein
MLSKAPANSEQLSVFRWRLVIHRATRPQSGTDSSFSHSEGVSF